MKRKTKKKVEFTLPFPPSVNKMYGNKKNGGRYLLPAAKNYYDACYFEIYHQLGKIPHFYKKITMMIEFFPRRNGGWDASNHFKAPEDALVKAHVIIDDSVKYLQPLAPVIHKRVPRDAQPYIKVTLEEI
jgi:Holliday junction resolvase RusA-like endonuclease